MRIPKTEDWLNSKTLEQIVKAVQATTIPNEKRTEFRVSSLPQCPLLELVGNKDEEDSPAEYDAHFYFGMGTALHELFQRFARDAEGVTLIGDWKCTQVLSTKNETNPPSEAVKRCSQTYEFCSYKTALKRHSCPHKLKTCKPDLRYVEITLSYNGLSGHIDLLFKINGKYLLADIKTTSNYLFDYSKKALAQGWYPAKKYWYQVETYAALIEEQKGIQIDQYAILYMSRERTSSGRKGHMIFVRKFTDGLKRTRMSIIDKQVANNKLVNKYMKRPNRELLKKIWQQRPCQTRKDYENEMGFKFFDKVCEFHKNGTCYSGKVMNTITKMYEPKTCQ